MHDIFISYTKNDKQLADAICHTIESEGIKCWIAPRDANAGYSYASEIVQAIKLCSIVVLVASKHVNDSQHVLNEVNLAVENNKIILPFKIDAEKFNEEYGYYLGKTHWIDAFPEPVKHFSKLIKNIGSLLEKRTAVSDLCDITFNEEKKKINRDKLIHETKEERLSFGLSIEDDGEELKDKYHVYKRLKRIDVIENDYGKYSSYRWLTIKNMSNSPTTLITHKECGENKIQFGSMNVKAHQNNYKGEKLFIESLTKIQPNFIQVFNIHFKKPLPPEDEMYIFYRLDWPGEPNSYCLDRISDSISLSRYIYPVEELVFGVLEKSEMIGVSIDRIDTDYNEKAFEATPIFFSVEEDGDLIPLHNKEYKGVYYLIIKPQDIGYRIFYKLITSRIENEDGFF